MTATEAREQMVELMVDSDVDCARDDGTGWVVDVLLDGIIGFNQMDDASIADEFEQRYVVDADEGDEEIPQYEELVRILRFEVEWKAVQLESPVNSGWPPLRASSPLPMRSPIKYKPPSQG